MSLYSIIPPAVLVLSLIGIIIFLAKKASQVALLENSAREIIPDAISKKRFLGKVFRRDKAEGRGFKHGFLVFLEKFTRKLRVFFLKLENVFTHWSENLKKRRSRHIEQANGENIRIEQEKETPQNIADSREAYSHETEKYQFRTDVYKKEPDGIKVEIQSPESGKKFFRPAVSEKVAIPKNKPEIKNRLERILIERIAANPKDTEAYERLGEYYFEIENYQHSKECFKQVIKLDPMNISVRDKMRKLERLLMKR